MSALLKVGCNHKWQQFCGMGKFTVGSKPSSGPTEPKVFLNPFPWCSVIAEALPCNLWQLHHNTWVWELLGWLLYARAVAGGRGETLCLQKSSPLYARDLLPSEPFQEWAIPGGGSILQWLSARDLFPLWAIPGSGCSETSSKSSSYSPSLCCALSTYEVATMSKLWNPGWNV